MLFVHGSLLAGKLGSKTPILLTPHVVSNHTPSAKLTESRDFLRGKDEDEPLLPQQCREHSCALLEGGKPNEFIYRLMMNDGETHGAERYRFRIVQKNSEKILFESQKIGEAYARAILRTFQSKQIGGDPYCSEFEMNTPEPLLHKYWNLGRRKIGWKTEEEKKIEKLLKECKTQNEPVSVRNGVPN